LTVINYSDAGTALKDTLRKKSLLLKYKIINFCKYSLKRNLISTSVSLDKFKKSSKLFIT